MSIMLPNLHLYYIVSSYKTLSCLFHKFTTSIHEIGIISEMGKISKERTLWDLYGGTLSSLLPKFSNVLFRILNFTIFINNIGFKSSL